MPWCSAARIRACHRRSFSTRDLAICSGNRRFAEGKAEHPWQDKETRESLIDTQNPDAVVLGCSDSRVPPEIIFDAGLGDMFTVRTAGQMIDPAVLQSLEYAVTGLHVSLLVVLGHQHCAAVQKGAEELEALITKCPRRSFSTRGLATCSPCAPPAR